MLSLTRFVSISYIAQEYGTVASVWITLGNIKLIKICSFSWLVVSFLTAMKLKKTYSFEFLLRSSFVSVKMNIERQQKSPAKTFWRSDVCRPRI